MTAIKSHRQYYGFTLVELAIVLTIVGLLIAMFLTPLTVQREIRGRVETQVLLEQARDALIGYAVANRHLPCSDTDEIPDGVENRNAGGDCVNDEGVLPWNTLGIDRVDAWGHYFRYSADTTFTNSTTLFTIADAETASGIQINGESGALVSTNSRPAALILSHGQNGLGAISTIQATPDNQLPAPAVGQVDELENTDGNLIFVSHVPTPKGSANEFDDLLIWLSPKVLINRMVVAGRLP
ncbi:MAG: type II secretion system protein [Methylotenera sp.]|nr:type II secretion system protein [Methylotenera sp.]